MLIKNISYIDEAFNVQTNMNIGVKGKVIDYISPILPIENYGEVYDGNNKVMMSGFFNCHTHLPMCGMRGYGENVCLNEWLNNLIFPYEDCLNNENVYAFTMISIAECLKFGITNVSDMYFNVDAIAKAVIDSGINANISRSIVSFDDTDLYSMDRFKEADQNFNQFNNYDEGRIRVDFSLHAEYTNTDRVIRQFAEAVSERKARVHIHLAETKKEVAECKARHKGMTPTEYFNSLGIFKNPTLAAHCVHLTKSDTEILKGKNVSITHCPVSNLKLASGIADINTMYNKGINITLGTDSVASNNNLNFLEEIKLFAILHKGKTYNPTLISPIFALQCATINGAKAQGRAESGAIKVGNKADFIIINTDSVNMQPIHNIVNNIVYSSVSSDILMTVVNGKVLYNNGEYKTIDIDKIKYLVNKYNSEILDKIRR